MATIRPTRLILINAAKFSYAEIDLTKPLHLVGQNNVGKTTLVNLLQLLYIDSLNEMSFAGYSLSETRRYYFPERHSYVLFECQGQDGVRVVGFCGKGPADGYDLERFAYRGYFERADFLDDTGKERLPRAIRDVKIRLATKEFTSLAPKHLRAALTGIGDNKGVRLGLVPVRDANGYSKFKDLFKGLIQLRRLRQEDLKATICDTYAANIGTRSVDLEKKYAEQFRKVRKQREQVEDLERIAPLIDDALNDARKQKELRYDLVRQWHTLEHTVRHYLNRLHEAAERAANTVQTKHSAIESAEAKISRLETKNDKQLVAIATLKRDIEEATDLIRRCQNVDPDALQEEIDILDRERVDLRAKLQAVETSSPDRIRKKLQSAEQEVERLKASLRNQETQLGPFLRQELGDDILNRLFRGLNPDILNLNRQGEHLNLTDPQALVDQLRAYDDALDGATIYAAWGQLSLDGLPAPDLDAYLNPERIRRDLQEEEKRVQTLRERLEVAVNQAQTEAREKDLRTQIQAHRDTRRKYEKSLEMKKKLPGLKEQRDAAEKERTATKTKMETLRARLDRLNEEHRAAKNRVSVLREAEEELRQKENHLTPPPDDWNESVDPESSDTTDAPEFAIPKQGDPLAPIQPVLDRFRKRSQVEQSTTQNLEKSLDRIHQTTYSKFERENIADTLRELREERDALEKRRANAEQLWGQLLTGMSRHLHDLINGLDQLRARVQTINRRLGNTSVSDLERLKLEVREISSTVNMLKRMNEREKMPLFSDEGAFQKDMDRLDAMLRQHPQIDIADLFDVGFEITTVDGERKSYDGLDNIQSNGTGITIKVLIHLVLINDLLSDTEKALPFYLDEASSLDERNLKGIVDMAREMDFVPILASPNESSAVDHLYFLRPDGDRVYLGPEHCVSTTEHHPSTASHAG